MLKRLPIVYGLSLFPLSRRTEHIVRRAISTSIHSQSQLQVIAEAHGTFPLPGRPLSVL